MRQGQRLINGDAFDRPARALGDGEVISLGNHRVRWFDAPHLPHAWECGVNRSAERASALAVDHAHIEDPAFGAGVQVLDHQAFVLGGRERVQVEHSVDRNDLRRFLLVHGASVTRWPWPERAH